MFLTADYLEKLPIKYVGLWKSVGEQFHHPHGRAGQITGLVMRFINRLPNIYAIRFLEIKQSEEVLEIGCGPGWALAKMAKLYDQCRITGVDLSSVMFKQAVANNKKDIQSGRVKLVQCSFENLPLHNSSVDKILAVNVLYFFDSDGRAFSELRRVLRTGGSISFYVTSKVSLANWKFDWSDTHRTFNERELSIFLQSGAFANDALKIHQVQIPFGIKGMVAVVRKT